MKRSPRDNAESRRRITRRALVLGGAQVAFAGILALRMRFMQVEQADEFRLLAEENRINIRLLPPARGLVFDRNGKLLAGNEQNYRIVIVKEDAGDVDAVIEKLRSLITLDEDEVVKARREIERRSAFVPVTLADRLSWDDVAKISVNAPALPGVTPEVGLSRLYPLGKDFAHVVGYVGPVSDYDLNRIENPDPLLQIPKFQIGKTGVEDKLETTLRGSAGTRRIEVNSVGRVMRELDRVEGQPGASVQLTIDSGLQNFVQARLGEESASAVVMDVTKGDLLAIASAPAFDPNKFVRGISVADYGQLTENQFRPLANKSVQGTYPPGSTFKMITALAALEAGVIDTEETIFCPGHHEVGGRRFHCWRRGGHGKVDLMNSISQSCDVYYYEISQRVGIEKIAQMARRLGLGTRHEVPLSAVARGLSPNKAWKREHRGADWVIGDTLNSGIGQGFVLSSPLQLAVMTARLASGLDISPRLVRSIDGIESEVIGGATLDVNPDHLRLIRRAMFSVSNHSQGTAYTTRIEEVDMKLAGKTGTSQVRNITAAERETGVTRNEDLPWERRDHALFVAFAPYVDPKIAVSVVVEHGGGGSTAAAPIVRDIVLQALYGGLPPLSAYPASQRRDIREMQEGLPLRDPDDPGTTSSRA